MFEGQQELALDDKGRLLMPARFKRALLAFSEGHMTVTRDANFPCLRAYVRDHWEKEIKPKLNALPEFDPAASALRWVMVGNAVPVDMDKQGRLLVPQDLRHSVGLEDKLTITGQGSYFELWSAQAYEARMTEIMAQIGNAGASPALANLSLQ